MLYQLLTPLPGCGDYSKVCLGFLRAAAGLERDEQHAEHHGVAGGRVGEEDEQPRCR